MAAGVLKLYGPWLGPEEEESAQSNLHLGRCFNVEVDGLEVKTRPSIAKWVDTAAGVQFAGLFAWGEHVYFGWTDNSREMRLWKYPGSVDPYDQVVIPATVSRAAEDPWWRAVAWQQWVIASHGSGAVYIDRAGVAKPFFPAQGTDKTVTAYLADLPPIRHWAVFQNRLHAAFKGTVLFSEADNTYDLIPSDGTAPLGGANLWPGRNNFDAKTGDDDQIQGLVPYSGALVIPTRRGLFVYTGDSLVQIGGLGNGCVAEKTVASLPNGVVYLGDDGPRVFVGGQSLRIPTGYEDTLRELTDHSRWSEAVGVHLPWRREYRLYLPTWKGTVNDLCLVWKYEEKRWFMWGGEPPWAQTEPSPYWQMDVAAACVVDDGVSPRLVTAPSVAGQLHTDIGADTDAGGKAIFSVVALRRLGLGEDQGVRVWRDVRIEARATGAVLKLAMLADGEDFYSRDRDCCGATTLVPNQTTWEANGASVARFTGARSGPVSTWSNWRIPHARIARTMQPVIYCDGKDLAGVAHGGKVAFRGVEIAVQPRKGRR